VPEVSRFYGIVITFNYAEHLPPHFHARYAGEHAAILITGELLAGALPARALSLVRTWVREHQGELEDDWERARRGAPLVPIEPLD
jgi:hypothetical protein